MHKLVIIGATEFQEPLVRRAKELGFETHVFAWRTGDVGEYAADYFYPVSITNHKSILQECRRIQPRAITSIGSDLAMLAVEHVASALGLPVNSHSAVMNSTNKIAMRRTFEKAGLLQPAFMEIGDETSPEEIENFSFPAVVKPSDRDGGRGVERVEDRLSAMRATLAARDFSFERKAILESYITGKHFSAETISFEGEHRLLAFTENEFFELRGTFCEASHKQPATLTHAQQKKLEECCFCALDAIGMTMGAAHTEFILDAQDNVYVIEVSTAMAAEFIGSDLVPFSTGMDYLKMVIDVACGQRPAFTMQGKTRYAQISFLHTQRDLQNLREIQRSVPGSIMRVQEDAALVLPETPTGKRAGYYITTSKLPELGGYLPLELDSGKEYFRDIPPAQCRRLNSGRTAIWCALEAIKPKRLHLPLYCNPAVARIAEKAGIKTLLYRCGEDFLPLAIETHKDDAVLLVNYFGLMDAAVHACSTRYANVIINNAAAFYCPPVWRDGVYNIYSCRKFFGVPDGAYLLGKRLGIEELEQDTSAARSGFLMAALEKGTNEAYQLQLASERELAQARRSMSELSFRLLDGIDYERVREKRRENYRHLDALLSVKNNLHFSLGEQVPQYYPFAGSEGLRSHLLKQRIYLPMLWRHVLAQAEKESVEYRAVDRICALPIDQRYGPADMEYVARLVLAYMD